MVALISGFTRVSSLGPIADFMERQGGSVFRVLRLVDLPSSLLERPETVLPMREQFRFLDCAAREMGDDLFGARLGSVVKARELSAFGNWVCSARTLSQAIDRAHAGIGTMLQTSTILAAERRGTRVRWSIAFSETETKGRHHNELLGIGYMIDMVRTFTASAWRPDLVTTTLGGGSSTAGLVDILGTNVVHGQAASAIEFDAALLGRGRLGQGLDLPPADAPEPAVPMAGDTMAMIQAIVELAQFESIPRIGWVAAKIGVSRRSLQRQLQSHGVTFVQLVEEALLRRATGMLVDGLSVTQVALELGYEDPAHFTRAFKRWTGVTPIAYRTANCGNGR